MYRVMDGSITVYESSDKAQAIAWARSRAAETISRAFVVVLEVARIRAVVTETKMEVLADV